VAAARNYGNPFGPKNDTYQVAKFQLTEPISKPRFKPSFKPRSYRRAPPCSCNDPSTTWRSCINAPSSPSPIELSNGSARHTPALVGIHSTSDNRLKRLRSCIDNYWSRRQSSPLVDTRPTSNSPSMRSPRSSILSDNTLPPIKSDERSVRQPSAFVRTHSTSNRFPERRRSRSNASSNFPSMLSGYGSARPSSPRGDTRPTSNISSRRSPRSGILSTIHSLLEGLVGGVCASLRHLLIPVHFPTLFQRHLCVYPALHLIAFCLYQWMSGARVSL
jgi:hypothetical protein